MLGAAQGRERDRLLEGTVSNASSLQTQTSQRALAAVEGTLAQYLSFYPSDARHKTRTTLTVSV